MSKQKVYKTEADYKRAQAQLARSAELSELQKARCADQQYRHALSLKVRKTCGTLDGRVCSQCNNKTYGHFSNGVCRRCDSKNYHALHKHLRGRTVKFSTCSVCATPIKFTRKCSDLCKKCYAKKYYSTHKERHAELGRKYLETNAERMKQYRTEYWANHKVEKYASFKRSLEDPTNKIIHHMRTRFSKFIKQRTGIWRHLSYTPQQLRNHLVSLFPKESGFTLENYGKAWVIDHKRPVASFVKTGEVLTVDDLKNINALSNLQPLSVIDNLKKSAKYIPEVELETICLG
jgi:hypothetical protein